MPGDDLPMYPTPQQSAAYAVGSSMGHGSRTVSGSRINEAQRQPKNKGGNMHYNQGQGYNVAQMQYQPGPQGYNTGYHQQMNNAAQASMQYHNQAPYGMHSANSSQNNSQIYYQNQVQSLPVQMPGYFQNPGPMHQASSPMNPQDYQNQAYASSNDVMKNTNDVPDKSTSQQQMHYQQPLHGSKSQNSLQKRPLPSQPTQQIPSNEEQYQNDIEYQDVSKRKGSPKNISNKQKLENELRVVFNKVDVNKSGKISSKELSLALTNFDHTRFQESTINLMLNLFSGSKNSSKGNHLNFEQFVSLWKYLSAYKKLFVAADINNSGDISFGEFQTILEQIGYKLNIDLVLFLFQKFAFNQNSYDGGMAVMKLKFDSFMELLVYLRKLTDIFKKYDKDLSGVATIGFSDFLFEISNLT